MGLKHWDPDQVDIIIGGAPMSGFADGSMIEMEEDGPRWVIVKGVDGTITRTKVLSKVMTWTLHLANTSRSNDVLSALHFVDMATSGGAGVVAGAVRDRNGSTLYTCPTQWIEGLPKDEMSDKATDRPWKVTCVDYIAFLGGT